ncbi:MAG TPA: hypothetical protein VJ965_06150 [Anaerolineales bacterium]|nr:hypothetical protein [Anaerolineales bacterium]
MNKWIKTSLILASIAVLSLGLMAFRPWGGDGTPGSSSNYTETLAEVLGISVEELQAAEQAAKETAVAQAAADGTITQEMADAILDGERGAFGGRGGRDGDHLGFSGLDMDAFLADELDITVEELTAARQEAKDILWAQSVEDGTLTQEDVNLMQAHQGVQPYLEEAFQQAYQDAIDAGLDAGAITEAQAQLLLDNLSSGSFGMGGFHAPGGRGGRGNHPFPGGAPETDSAQP